MTTREKKKPIIRVVYTLEQSKKIINEIATKGYEPISISCCDDPAPPSHTS